MTCQLILTLIVGPQYEDQDIGINPCSQWNSQECQDCLG